MNLSEIEALANKSEPFETDNCAERYYYLAMQALYSLNRTDKLFPVSVCLNLKKLILKDYEKLSAEESLHKGSVKMMFEISKITAPLSETKNKSKAELLDIVDRILIVIDGVGFGGNKK